MKDAGLSVRNPFEIPARPQEHQNMTDEKKLIAPRLPRGFEDVPCPLDVRLERCDRITIGDPDDRLCRKVEYGVDFVLTVRAHQQRQIGRIAAPDALHEAAVVGRRARGGRVRQVKFGTHGEPGALC